MARGLTSQGVMDKNEFALVIMEIDTKLVSPHIVLSQESITAVIFKNASLVSANKLLFQMNNVRSGHKHRLLLYSGC